MADVTIYTKEGCPYCAAAREHYASKGIEFDDIDIHSHPEVQEKVIKMAGGKRFVPVIVENGEVKVGFGGG